MGKTGNLLNRFSNNEHFRERRVGYKAVDEDAPVTFADGRVTVIEEGRAGAYGEAVVVW